MCADPPAGPGLDVGVLGSINQDTIAHADGRVEQSLGGVLFTACALAHLGGGHLRVHLLARVPAALSADLHRRLAPVPGLCLDGLLPTAGPGYRCHITYDGRGGKSEILSGWVEPLGLPDLAPFLPHLRALVVNFITGYELEGHVLAGLRQGLDAPLMMDVHSLTLGRDADGRRFPRRPEGIERWLATADLAQMNESEAVTLGAPADVDGQLAWAEARLHDGPAAVVITRGAAGAVAAERRADGSVRRLVQPPAPLPPGSSLDPTGCGDVFLAALTAARVRGADLESGLALASRAAARNCRLTGIDQLHRLVAGEPATTFS